MKSIIQESETCFLCGRNRHAGLEWHHIFGGANRKHSEEDGLKVLLCADCHRLGPHAAHRDAATQHYLHYIGRSAYLIHHTPEEFRQRYGRNYDNDAGIHGEP